MMFLAYKFFSQENLAEARNLVSEGLVHLTAFPSFSREEVLSLKVGY